MVSKRRPKSADPKRSEPGLRSAWRIVVGASLIFASWVLQNHYAAQATEERIRLRQSQLVIDVQQNRLEQWQTVRMTEYAKAQPNDDIRAAAALKILQSYANLQGWSAARLRSDAEAAQDIIDGKNELQDRAQRLYVAGQLADLEALVDSTLREANRLGVAEQLTQQFQEQYSQVTARETRLNWAFFASYVVGSLILAWEWVRARPAGG